MITKDKIAKLRSLIGKIALPTEVTSYWSIIDQTGTIAYDLEVDEAILILEALNALPELLEVYEMYEDLCR